MSRILIGVIAALVIGSSLLAWRWRASVEERIRVEEALLRTSQALQESQRQLQLGLGRESALSDSLGAATERLRRSQTELAETRDEISNLKREEGDTDEQMSCLDVVLPAAADRLLREAGGRAD